MYVTGIYLTLNDSAIDATSDATATVEEKDYDHVGYIQLEMDVEELNSKGIIIDSGTIVIPTYQPFSMKNSNLPTNNYMDYPFMMLL